MAGAVGGAMVGGVFGGLAGKGIAEAVNPTEVDEYWKQNYKTRSYIEPSTPYETYQPAYRYGYEARTKFADQDFASVEPELRSDWEKSKTSSGMAWDKAKPAIRDSFDYTGDLYRERTHTEA